LARDSQDLGVQVKVLQPFQIIPFSLGSGGDRVSGVDERLGDVRAHPAARSGHQHHRVLARREALDRGCSRGGWHGSANSPRGETRAPSGVTALSPLWFRVWGRGSWLMAEGLGFLIYRYFIYSTDHTKIGGCGLYGLLNKSNSSILETLNRKPSTIIHEPQRGVWHTSRLVGDGHPPASRAVPPQSGRSLTIRARSVHNIMLFLFVQKNILQQSVAVCVYIYIYIYT